MTLTIEPTGATLGAYVTGVDLAALDDGTYAGIEDAWHEHGVLIFPGQHPSDETQAAFGERVGRLERFHSKQTAKVTPISNRKPDGTLLKPDDYGSRLQRATKAAPEAPTAGLAGPRSCRRTSCRPRRQTEWATARATTPWTRYGAPEEGLSAHLRCLLSQS